MQFNSPEYLFFFIIVFFVFWFLLRNNLRIQNIFLLAANYIFYAWWDWRFLFLIIFISGVNYYAGIQTGKRDPETQNRGRKRLLIFSILVNLTLLAVFKYFNFFAGSFADLFHIFGFSADNPTLNIILPIGISFYTFQTMSYTIDVYRTKVEPTRDIIAFFAYISFFPLILAGPIERAGNLLVQFFKKKEFNYDEGADAMRQILWGLFKKVVIADNCAKYANEIFSKYETQPGAVLLIGSIYFAFQIYGDFSGYSDIAIGSAKLLGFKLTTNFRTPYFSRDIAEFWRRWHISLSSWLRDYLFMPLNIQFRNLGKWGGALAILITFLICGLWHGANWTFIVWGGLNGIYLIPSLLTGRSGRNINTVAEGSYLPNLKEIFQMTATFTLVCFSWIFFKAETISQAFAYIGNLFSNKFLPDNPYFFPRYMLSLLFFFLFSEWFLFRYDNSLERFAKLNVYYRRPVYAITLILIFLFIQNEASSFIYFQF